MNEGFMVAVFVAGAELQMAVEKKAKVVLKARENKMLIAGFAREDDFIGVDVVFCGRSNVPGASHAGAQSAQNDNASNAQAASARKLAGEKKGAPEGDACVNQAKKHGRANQAEARHKQDRKQKRGSERAEIIEGQNVCDDVAEVIAVLDDSHKQRNFQANENAHHDDQGVKNQFETLSKGEG